MPRSFAVVEVGRREAVRLAAASIRVALRGRRFCDCRQLLDCRGHLHGAGSTIVVNRPCRQFRLSEFCGVRDHVVESWVFLDQARRYGVVSQPLRIDDDLHQCFT